MMNNRTLAVIVLLSIFVARTRSRGEDQTMGPNLIQQRQASELESKLTVFEAQTFLEGSNVTLKCDSNKVKWNELIYIVWNISLQSRKCWLGLSSDTPESTCKDGKMLRNSTDGVSLFIPRISKKDEGSYSCDLSYKGGSYDKIINVSVHHFTSRLEVHNDQTVAICQARYETSVPTLQWEPALNVSSNISYARNSDMSFIVENRLYLPDNVSISNLKCVATYPPSPEQQNTRHDLTKPEIIAIAAGSMSFFLVSLAVVYVLRRKLNNLSVFKMLCCKSKIPAPAEDKPPQAPDVEEVEPYASYIQRVNSIYNSSAELFNA